MAQAGGEARQGATFAVGARVRTAHATDTSAPREKWPVETGTIVDEFGGIQDIANRDYGRDWAVSKRWAIALDNGTLVFRDDGELEPDAPEKPGGTAKPQRAQTTKPGSAKKPGSGKKRDQT